MRRLEVEERKVKCEMGERKGGVELISVGEKVVR